MRRASSVRVGYAVVGLLCALVFSADLTPTITTVAFVLLGVATCASLLLGPALNHVDRTPWALVAVAMVLFALGAAVRPLSQGSRGLLVTLPDVFLLPGYATCAVGLVLLLRRREGVRDVHASADTLIVLNGAISIALALLMAPAIEVTTRPLWVSLVSAVYPVLDVFLLCVLVQLGFTTRELSWSLTFLAASITALLVGDFYYAYLNTQGRLVAPHAVDVVYAVSYLLLGATALHPSVGSLTVGRRRELQGWSLPRMLMVVPALTAPVVLLSVASDGSPLLRTALAVLAVVATGMLVTRAMSAVRALGRLQRATAHEATHDPLTGLPNRVHLDAWLVRELQRSRALTVLFLDLDGFKLVNDSFGHAAGDELLGAVAARLRRVTPTGAVLARLGGDEFVLARVGNGGCSPSQLAEVMLAAIAEPFTLSVAQVVVTGSIGIAGSGGTSTAQDLVREADTAMYRAKASGSGTVATFDASMRALVRERLDLEQALRQALPLGQLSVVFQPVVALPSGRVVSHEALLRWNHPTRGAVAPSTFIDLAEDAGLIVEIGEWVLLQSLEVLARRWRAGDRHLTVAVNVAGRQLADPTLPRRVARALDHHGLPPSVLKLEITESAMLQDGGDVERTMAELVAGGVRLSMDDFGTGFSSLSYLRRLPVAEVKIDRSFVAGIVDSPADEEIVRAATAMAHALRLEVVAEGVETVEQRLMLQRLGVDRGQGWLFGRPVPGPADVESTSECPSATSASATSLRAAAGS